MDYFLGLDSSTQSFTGILIDLNQKRCVYSYSVNFDKELPQYKTQNGVYIYNGGKVVHSNPLMWVEALELLLNNFIQVGLPLGHIKAI